MAANGNVNRLDFTTFSNIINGQTTQTKSVRYGINPANKTALFPSPVSSRDDVSAAIKAARTAFGSWKKTPIELRKEKIKALCAELLAHKTEFSRLLTTEQGKPVCVMNPEAIAR